MRTDIQKASVLTSPYAEGPDPPFTTCPNLNPSKAELQADFQKVSGCTCVCMCVRTRMCACVCSAVLSATRVGGVQDGKNTGLGVSHIWVQIPTLPLSSSCFKSLKWKQGDSLLSWKITAKIKGDHGLSPHTGPGV